MVDVLARALRIVGRLGQALMESRTAIGTLGFSVDVNGHIGRVHELDHVGVRDPEDVHVGQGDIGPIGLADQAPLPRLHALFDHATDVLDIRPGQFAGRPHLQSDTGGHIALLVDEVGEPLEAGHEVSVPRPPQLSIVVIGG